MDNIEIQKIDGEDKAVKVTDPIVIETDELLRQRFLALGIIAEQQKIVDSIEGALKQLGVEF